MRFCPEIKGLQAGLFSWGAGYSPPGLLMQLQSVSQRSSEVAGDFGFGNRLGLAAGSQVGAAYRQEAYLLDN